MMEESLGTRLGIYSQVLQLNSYLTDFPTGFICIRTKFNFGIILPLHFHESWSQSSRLWHMCSCVNTSKFSMGHRLVYKRHYLQHLGTVNIPLLRNCLWFVGVPRHLKIDFWGFAKWTPQCWWWLWDLHFELTLLEIIAFVDSISIKTSIPSAAAFKAGTVITHY